MWNATPATKIILPKTSPVENNVVFLNSYTGVYKIDGVVQAGLPAPDVWHNIDLKPLGVPADALAVDIRGFLIITSGTGSQIPDLAVAWQAPDGTFTPAKYAGQAVSIGPTGGARTNSSSIVPVVNGVIQFAWLRGDGPKGEYPGNAIVAYSAGASYGLNFTIQAIYMP